MIRLIIFFLLASPIWIPPVLSEESPRYISLAPATTEILFALGLQKDVVAVSSYCDYPPEALKKPRIGSFSQPNIEMILSLKPDQIFCTGLEQSQVIEQLKGLNLNVYVSDPQTLDELYASILEIGRITRRAEQAESLICSMKEQIASVRQQVRAHSSGAPVTVFVEIWSDPLTTAGKGSFIDEVVRAAGGRNIAYDTVRPYSVISAELVIQRNPDCIIFAYMDKALPRELIARRPGWQGISAVETGKLYNDIDPNILLRPGPRIAEAVKQVYIRLYER